jgi:hypothetical protein
MRPSDFWPSKAQELLLMAALADGEAAMSAWRAWRSRVSLETADHGSLRLMPLVYWNLRRAGGDDPAMPALKALYIRTRYANRVLLQRLERLLLLFAERAIPTLVLKGAALGPAAYRDPALRPMADLDIAVPHRHARAAVALLLENGWSRPGITTADEVRAAFLPSLDFSASDGLQCDLHFSPFAETLSWEMIAPLWSAATPLTIGEAATLTLSPTDQLLHTLAHGARANPIAPIRWVADAMWLLRGDAPVDWERFVAQAECLRLTLVVAHTLAYLRDVYGAPVPPSVLAAMEGRCCALEAIEYRARQGLLPRWAEPPICTWGRYVRANRQRRLPALIGGFPFYLQEQWSTPTLRQTARMALRKLLSRRERDIASLSPERRGR